MRSHIFAIAVSLGVTQGQGVAPTAKVKNGTYSGIYLDNFKQDFFASVAFAQVNENLRGSYAPDVPDCRPTDLHCLATRAFLARPTPEHNMG